jgi:hypothetical protein
MLKGAGIAGAMPAVGDGQALTAPGCRSCSEASLRTIADASHRQCVHRLVLFGGQRLELRPGLRRFWKVALTASALVYGEQRLSSN